MVCINVKENFRSETAVVSLCLSGENAVPAVEYLCSKARMWDVFSSASKLKLLSVILFYVS